MPEGYYKQGRPKKSRPKAYKPPPRPKPKPAPKASTYRGTSERGRYKPKPAPRRPVGGQLVPSTRHPFDITPPTRAQKIGRKAVTHPYQAKHGHVGGGAYSQRTINQLKRSTHGREHLKQRAFALMREEQRLNPGDYRSAARFQREIGKIQAAGVLPLGGAAKFFAKSAGDVGHVLTGIPLGLYAGGRAIAHDTSTLFSDPYALIPGFGLAQHYARGQTGEMVKQSGEQIYEDFRHPLRHPVYTASNLLLLSSGTGAVAKLGGAAARRGLISPENRLVRAGRPVPLAVRSPSALARAGKYPELEGFRIEGQAKLAPLKVTSGQPVRKGIQLAVHKALKNVPVSFPHWSEPERWARALRHPQQRYEQRFMTERSRLSRGYQKAFNRLNESEKIVLNLRPHDVSPQELLSYYRKTGKSEPEVIQILSHPKLQQLWDNPSKNLERALVEDRRLSEVGTRLLIEKRWLKPETAREAPYRLAREVAGGRYEGPKGKKVLVGGEEAFKTRKPYYQPLKAPLPRIPNSFQALMGGGKGVPRIPVKASEGVISELAASVHGEDIHGPEFLTKLIRVYHDDLHNALLEGSVRVPASQLKVHGLPEGWEYVRRRTKRSPEKVPKGPEQRAAYARAAEESMKQLDIERTLDPMGEGFGTAHPELAETVGKSYVIAPKRVLDNFAGEFTRSNKTVRLLFQAPTNAWRTIILGYRPGFFTNNLVGNALLYAAHVGPIGGLRPVVDIPRGKKLPRRFYEERFPEHLQGAFGTTQRPRLTGTAQKVAKASLSGILPATQAVTEVGFRRGIIHTLLAKNPEVKRIYRAMPRQARSFEKAAGQALDQNPALARQVSGRVNDALGNYLGLGQTERRVLRQLAPFYAWYRSIIGITAKMPLETPGRTFAIIQLGRIGHEMQNEQLGDVPSYLQGAIPIGEREGDIQKILTTQGLNPWATIPQLFTAGEEVSALNPFIQPVAEVLAQRPWEVEGGVPWLRIFGRAIGDVAGNLPFAQFARGPSSLYPRRGPRQQTLGFFGLPLKDVSLSEARARAQSGEGGGSQGKQYPWSPGATSRGKKYPWSGGSSGGSSKKYPWSK